MDPMIAVALLALGVGIGWAGHGLWSARHAKAKHQALIADLRRQFEAKPGELKLNRQLDPDELERFKAKFDTALRERPHLASGGWISAPKPGDDSIPFLLSEGGCLLYPRGDHSGPTAMDGQGEDIHAAGIRDYEAQGKDALQYYEDFIARPIRKEGDDRG